VTAFADTVHPILTDYCSSCHAGAGPATPHIAHPDPLTAHDAVLFHQKVDLGSPATSRLVRRLVADFHHCWGSCNASGAEMLVAIDAWARAIDYQSGGGGTTVDAIASQPRTLADGIEDEGGPRHTAGLLALWDFKEGSGGVAFDQSGFAPAADLELSGSVDWMSSHGLDFDDGMALASIEASRKLYDRIARAGVGTQQYSLEAWVTAANVSQEGPARIVSYSLGNGSRNVTLGQVLYSYNVRNRSLVTNANGSPALQTSDADRDLQATLQHVVVTYDQYRGRRVYVDGVFTDDLDAEGPGRLWNWDAGHRLVLGNETSGGRAWDGQIRLAAVYEYALSDEQIQQNFDAGVGRRLLLRFDVSVWAGAGAYVEFLVRELDDYSYLFCEPRVVAPNSSGGRLTNLRIAVNGQVAVSGQAFVHIDLPLGPTPMDLSPQCSVIQKIAGPGADVFSLEFEHLGDFLDPVVPPPPPTPPTPQFGPAPPGLGIRAFERLHETFAAVTGVDATSPAVRDTFEQLTQQLPGDADLRAFSASQQVAISKLALEYCDSLVESSALRDAFFGTSPPFDFDAPVPLAFAAPGQRDLVIDTLVDRFLGVGLSDQPDPGETALVLHGLLDELTLGCDVQSCGADRTRTVVKSACAAVLASSAVSVH
jgi:hypothetical protein